MPLFGNRQEERRRQQATISDEGPRDELLQEELSELVAVGEPREVHQALSEAEQAVIRGNRQDIYGIKLIESGRCPQCSSRTENYLYTTVCPACGWYRRRVPDSGHCQVHLGNGRVIECDRVFPVSGEQLLCVTGGVVRHQVMMQAVHQIEYLWTPEELEKAKHDARRNLSGTCSWCDGGLGEGDEDDAPYVDYVAFGQMQERYVFCSTRCMNQFRTQFPSRVHRNCYETDCADCDKCIKRFDVSGFRRKLTS